MAGEMFGSPIGRRQAELDVASLAHTAAQIPLLQAQTELATTAATENRAQARNFNAQAAEKEQDLDLQKRIAARMAQTAQDPAAMQSSNPADIVDDVAKLYMREGAVVKGSELANKAATIRMHQSSIESNQALMQRRVIESAQKEADWLIRALPQVKSEADMANLNAGYEQLFGMPSPLKGRPYDPVMIDSLSRMALSEKDRLDLQLRAQQLQRQEQADSDRAKTAATTRDLNAAREALARKRADLLEKNAGKAGSVSAPTLDQRFQAEDLLKKEVPGLSTEDRKFAGATIASRARALLKSIPGIDWDQALARALNEERQAGSFPQVREGANILGIETSLGAKTGFLKGRSPGNAMPLPKDAKPSALTAGRYYISPSGQIGLWDGKAMKVVPAIQGGTLPQGGGGGGTGDDGEDDE